MTEPVAHTAQLVNLVQRWIEHFWSADHEIEWKGTEEELSLELAPDVLLVGRTDARGVNAEGENFFGEWKTANPRGAKHWKQVWRLNPQSLTYGVLYESLGIRSFCVRKAFKSNPPIFDHAWFTYTPEELAMWRGQLVTLAHEIRVYRRKGNFSPEEERLLRPIVTEWPHNAPWPLNPNACFQYGPAYVCPFFETGCSKLNFETDPLAPKREPHLEIERQLRLNGGRDAEDLVVLDATRVSTWLGCRERYRREYEENVATEKGEALELGIQFHGALGSYYRGLIK